MKFTVTCTFGHRRFSLTLPCDLYTPEECEENVQDLINQGATNVVTYLEFQ